jgi:transposase
VYEGKDSFGNVRQDVILYKSYTVAELERKSYDYRVINEELRYAKELEKHEKGKGRKPRHRTIKPESFSAYKDDHVFVYRDETVHAAMIKEYREKIGLEAGYTEENLQAEQDSFGVFVLRTDRKDATAEDTFLKYKKRWSIETNYNFLKNSLDFKGLKTQDYHVMQGLSFLSVVVGQIHADYRKKKKSSVSTYARNLSIRESLIKAAHMKVTQHQNKHWYISINKTKSIELLSEMGVSVANDLGKLDSNTY